MCRDDTSCGEALVCEGGVSRSPDRRPILGPGNAEASRVLGNIALAPSLVLSLCTSQVDASTKLSNVTAGPHEDWQSCQPMLGGATARCIRGAEHEVRRKTLHLNLLRSYDCFLHRIHSNLTPYQ